MDGRVPVIDSSCRVLNSKQFKRDCNLLKLFAMVSAKAAECEEEGQILKQKLAAVPINAATIPKIHSAKSARRRA